MYLQVSLGLKQLKFPIVLLVFGILTSVVLFLLERLSSFMMNRRKNNSIFIQVLECQNSNMVDNIGTDCFKHFKKQSIQEHIQELNLLTKEMDVFLNESAGVNEQKPLTLEEANFKICMIMNEKDVYFFKISKIEDHGSIK